MLKTSDLSISVSWEVTEFRWLSQWKLLVISMFSFSLDFSFLSAWTPITLVFLPPKLDFKFLIFMSYCPCPKNPKYRVNECNNLLSPALPKATDDKWRKIIQSHTHTQKLWFSLPMPSTMNGIPFTYYWSAPSFIPLSHYSKHPAHMPHPHDHP